METPLDPLLPRGEVKIPPSYQEGKQDKSPTLTKMGSSSEHACVFTTELIFLLIVNSP